MTRYENATETAYRAVRAWRRAELGFTLIEMALVVALIMIFMSLGIAALSAQMSKAAYEATQKKQALIKDALINYLGRNRRLPCPSDFQPSLTPGAERTASGGACAATPPLDNTGAPMLAGRRQSSWPV